MPIVKIAYGLLALILVLPVVFCFFGTLASQEPGTPFYWTIGYVISFFLFLSLHIFCIKKSIES